MSVSAMRSASRFDMWTIALIEALSGLLVVVEFLILLAGVIFRYALHSPLFWTDELSSILFEWLLMFGSVICLRRHQHMRLTAIIDRMSARTQARAATFASIVMLTFLVLIIGPAYLSAQSENAVSSPALGIPGSVRLAALLVGFVLMAYVIAADLIRRSYISDIIVSLVVVAVAAAGLWLASDWLQSIDNYNLIVTMGLIAAVCVFLGVPIAFAFAIATIAYFAFVTEMPFAVVTGRMDEGMSNPTLLAVPLFIVLGVLMEVTGLARTMIRFLVALLGHINGGLYYVVLCAMYLISGISGAKVADMGAIVPVLFPEMRRQGYNRGEMIALLASSGAMAETIPPSLVLITIGSVTTVSIAALFTGGLLPAFVIALALGIFAFVRSRRETLQTVKRASFKEVVTTFVVALPAIALPFIIRISVVEGIATATEVATIGIVYTILVGALVYRDVQWGRIYRLLVDTAALSGAVLFIIGTATAMSWALAQSGFSDDLVAWVTTLPGGSTGFMLVSIVLFIVLGSVLEGIPALVLFGPLLFPVAQDLGIDEVHYAIVMVLAMGLGLFAPPFGVGFYITCAIGQISPNEAMRPVWGYLAIILVAIIVIAMVPWVSTGFL